MNANIIYSIQANKLNRESSSGLRQELKGLLRQGRSLLLDLSKVEAVDATTADLIAELAIRFVEQGGMLRLTGLRGGVAAFFELLRLSHLVEPVKPTVHVSGLRLVA